MRKIIYIFVIMLFVTLQSCQDDGAGLLDKAESGDITEEQIFSEGALAKRFLNNVYSRLPKGYFRFGATNPVYLGVTTDEGQQAHLGLLTQALWFNTGTWNAANPSELPAWKYAWTAIRPANKIIENIDKVPLSEQEGITEASKLQMKTEARMLRAIFYAELLKSYGGVPIIKRQLTQFDEELYTPRSTFDQTVDFIVSECDSCALILPANNRVSDPVNFGRMTAMAAKALKARVLLYAARPLFNDPENTNRIIAGEYDPMKWERAAIAGWEAIKFAEENDYSLYVDSDPKESYRKLFITRGTSEEIITYIRSSKHRECEARQLPLRFHNTGNDKGGGFTLPSLSLVESYEMKNGINIYQNGSGWDPQNPYINRDQRFYSSIYYNQSKYKTYTFEIYDKEPGSNVTSGVDFFTDVVNTGFYLRKFIDETINPNNGAAFHNHLFLRYAEVLLNYAEAANMAFGPYNDHFGDGKTAKWAVDQVRARALQPQLPDGMSTDSMYVRIKNESKVEFAFEEHRFYDCRHWKETKPFTEVKLQTITKNDNGSFKYGEAVRSRVFRAPTMFLLPIPIDDISNAKYIQNPGW